jgi:PAS domain S-box-containing protein
MKKFNFLLITVYLLVGGIWLISGSWLIIKLKKLDPSVDLQYLFDIKNMLFLIVSVTSIVLIINERYSRLLLKEQVLNKQLLERELQLHKALNDYKLVNIATNDVIWDYDIVKDELKWLHGYQELFGYEDDVTVKATFWNMQKIHPDEREYVISMFHKLLKSDHHKWTIEYRYLCKNGVYKYVSDRGYLIRNDEQHAVRMLGAIQDIDQAKTYSMQLEAQNKRLKEIAWLNSHEIRRPLCNITGLLPIIKASADDPESLIELVDLLEISAHELDATIHKVNENTNILI